MKGRAPNSPLTGSQLRPHRNEKPNSRIEGMELAAIATTIAETISRIRNATERSAARKTASPVEPVADMARLKLQRRATVPYSAAGLGMFGCGFIMTER